VGWSYGGYAAAGARTRWQQISLRHQRRWVQTWLHVPTRQDYFGWLQRQDRDGAAGNLKDVSPANPRGRIFRANLDRSWGPLRSARARIAVAQPGCAPQGGGQKEGTDFVYVEQPLNTHNLLREEDRIQFCAKSKKFLDAA